MLYEVITYSNESQIETIEKINKLENELQMLKRVTNSDAQPEFISKQIDEKYILLQKYIENNDYERVNSVQQDLLVLMNIYNEITSVEKKSVFDSRINSITEQINNLKVSQPISTIVAEDSGYFVSYVDGFEDKLNFNNINNLTVTDIDNIIANNIQNDFSAVGKIIDGYTWEMIGVIIV